MGRGTLIAMRRNGGRTTPAAASPGQDAMPTNALGDTDSASMGRVFDHSVMRERILAAAVTIVATQGFAACTVREVAEAAGIKAPGLYSHFPSKEAILSEAVSRVLDDFMENAAAVPDSSPEQELKDTVRRHVLYQIDNQLLAQVTDVVLNTASAGRVVSAGDYERLLADQRAYIDLVSRRVAAYAPDLGPAQVMAATRAIIAMCDGVATWYGDGDLEPEALADLHWRFVRRMLG
jgi:AcrR family transcriptional regulator